MNSLYWGSVNGLSKVWVHAVDEHDRPFEFEVVAHGNQGKLVNTKIDAVRIDPQMNETIETLQSSVTAEIAELGIREVETAKIENSKP